MKSVVTANSLWAVVKASSLLSKVILVGASAILIVCMFIFIYKLLLMREKLRQVEKVRVSLQSAETLNDIVSISSTLSGTLPGVLIGRGLRALKTLLQRGEATHQKLSAAETELFESAVDQALFEVMQKENTYLPFLSVSAAVAPLVGLFGTISGLIQAFLAIGIEKSTDITTIAPGIAEALLTTFAGIVVAILAYIMYQYLVSKNHDLESKLIGLVHHFEWVVKRMLIE